MLLSVCILMKDEIQSLRLIAAATRGLADEIVVVYDDHRDAGFKDAAEKCRARVVTHRWQNDFAAARNAGLQAARGEWVFWIDSDETPVFRSAEVVRKLLEPPDVLGYYVTIEDAGETSTMTSSRHLRLYRRREEIQYLGRIHEHFIEPLESLAEQWGMKILSSPVKMCHTGYLSKWRAEKLKRNIALLELELADRPRQLYYLVELGRSLLLARQLRGHDVMAEAAQVLHPTLQQSKSPNPSVAALLEYTLSHAPPNFPMAQGTAAEAVARWYPSCPPLIWLVSRWHFQQGRVGNAAKLLQQVLEMGEKKNYDNTLSFDQRIFGDETRLNFGVCCARLGQTEKAREQFSLIKFGSPFYSMAEQNAKHLNQK
jgi:Glycosyl transferase family 2